MTERLAIADATRTPAKRPSERVRASTTFAPEFAAHGRPRARPVSGVAVED